MDFLDGIRVLDVTQVWAGPMATMHLGNLGAEVIKVERPGAGEVSRSTPPFVDGMSAYFSVVNTDKHCITLDLSTDEGREVFLELAETADVIVENNKPGTVEKFGIDYDAVEAVNPEIVYCSIRGFGEGSAYEEHPSFDIVVQAMSGAMSITGEPDGPPLRCAIQLGDISAGMYAVETVLAALFEREFNDAGGRYIEVPMMNAMVAWLRGRMVTSLVRGEPYPRTGSEHTDYVPYTNFETADSYIVVAAGTDALWERMCEAVGREDLLDDPRFETNADRVEHKEALYPELEPVFRERTTEEWFEVLSGAGVPCGPVYDTLEVWDDPYPDQQELLTRFTPESVDGSIPSIRYPVNVDGEYPESDPPQPLGAETEDYLAALGYSPGKIERLRERDVI